MCRGSKCGVSPALVAHPLVNNNLETRQYANQDKQPNEIVRHSANVFNSLAARGKDFSGLPDSIGRP
jgi:hypothetical protein